MIGYLDDITLGGEVHQVAADIEIVVKDAEAMGLILNANKCELISFESENIPPIVTFDNYQLTTPNDAISPGSPILPGPAVDLSLKSKFDTLKKAIERMQYIDAHDALLFFKSSLHLPKLLYILRTSVCHGNPILDDIDDITLSSQRHIQESRSGSGAGSQPQNREIPRTDSQIPLRTGSLGDTRPNQRRRREFLV